jgi:release factor glutamine methyltransferase
VTTGRSLPRSFSEALLAIKEVLQSNSQWVAQGRVDSEAEQCITAGYRVATGVQLSRVDLFLKSGELYPVEASDSALEIARRRATGEPLQYIVGYQFFLNHEYSVMPGVLIPRPETEVLLTSVMAELARNDLEPQLGLEVGLGSGIISIELLCQYSQLNMWASDVSSEAQRQALHNAQRILGPGFSGADRLKIVRVESPRDVLQPFGQVQADFIISNPPYLSRVDAIDQDVMSAEPHLALFAPDGDPLYFYREIAHHAGAFLKNRGYVFAEIPHERASQIVDLFSSLDWTASALPDLTGRDRVLIARLKSESQK